MRTTAERGIRAGTIAGALLAVLILVAGCASADTRPTDAGRATAVPAPRGPGGNGGLLVGARWYVQWITVGGRVTTAPPRAAAWVEFGRDGTAEGNYGCVPFRAAVTVAEAALTVGRKVDGGPSAEHCPTSYRVFGEKLRKLFSGPLGIDRRVDDLTMDLRNREGDYVAVKLIRPQGLFGSRWRLDHVVVGDSVAPVVGGEEVYYVFHRDGTVTGKAGCNDFTGRAVFDDDTLSMDRLTRTTHRTCSRELMDQERMLLTDEMVPRRMEYGHALTRAFEAIDESRGLDRFGYGWVAMPNGS
ncbi:META domain-containing protein [Streptomyces sp. NPDC004520]|uniref:META domain-containing protein n=1 Tax=Streptomyces sp. NPDC004520 TaxID=3364702 RepID=UPI00369E8B99